MSIQLLLADPHPVMLEGLDHVFRQENDFTVCSLVQDGEAARRGIRQLQPQVVIHELKLPKLDGVSLIRSIRSDGMSTIPVVFTSAPADLMHHLAGLGHLGLIGKDKPRHVLLECVRAVLQGHPWLDPDLSDPWSGKSMTQTATDQLTPREWCVAQLVVEGLPNKRIAHRLNISEGTAKLHLHHIYQKLQCSGRMALMLYMKNNGLA
jgi:DNA-binding NarL/FixJ family response regulator